MVLWRGPHGVIDRSAGRCLSCCLMPTYEYKCPNGHAFEKYYPRMNDRRHVPCPICGKRAERMISGGGGLVFRGSGFYITDYKRAGEQTGRKEGDAQPAESKPTQSKPAESKAAESKAAESKAAESKTPESSKKKDSRDK
jgi:putative FmdB family regulatory protein